MKQHLAKLLDRLCIDFGFCLHEENYERLMKIDFVSSAELTDAIFKAEGLDRHRCDKRLWEQVYVHVNNYLKAV